MDSTAVSATREKITGEIKSLGAVVVSTPEGKGGCCTTGACLQELQSRGVAGLVEVSVLRFGSVVRINLRFFSAATQKQILHIKAKASATDFPASASLKSVLKKGIESLRPKPVVEKPVEKPVTEVVPPPPTVREPRVEGVVKQESDSTWYWVGGSLAAGGAILAGVGIYFLMGPMQDAMDRRDQARDDWLLATEPAEIERYRSIMRDQDQKASDYHTLGWVGTGVGAAMAVGGVLVMLLLPESKTPVVRPLALRQGGGIVLYWSFH
jgi:hypothetical protein